MKVFGGTSLLVYRKCPSIRLFETRIPINDLNNSKDAFFGVLKMAKYKMSGREFFCCRMINFFLLAIIITYALLYLFLQTGSYGLFFAGAIVGGLWGIFWERLLNRKAPEGYIDSPFSRPFNIIMAIVFLAFIAFLIFYYPLP